MLLNRVFCLSVFFLTRWNQFWTKIKSIIKQIPNKVKLLEFKVHLHQISILCSGWSTVQFHITAHHFISLDDRHHCTVHYCTIAQLHITSLGGGTLHLFSPLHNLALHKIYLDIIGHHWMIGSALQKSAHHSPLDSLPAEALMHCAVCNTIWWHSIKMVEGCFIYKFLFPNLCPLPMMQHWVWVFV